MIIRKLILIFVFYIIIFLFSCKTEQIILPGKIKGLITDSETSEPIQGVSVKLIESYVPTDSASTKNDGTYLLKNIAPGDYKVQASKFDYNSSIKDIKVHEAETGEINFNLTGIPVSSISVTYLDYGLELTSLSFAISNIGKRKLTYVLTPSHSWITVYPSYGDVTDETDSINVTINKTDLSDSITYIGEIEITSIGGPSPIKDTIGIYLNGILDIRDLRYYKVVKIGSQTWMAENLNIGRTYSILTGPSDDGNPEKLCYYENEDYCKIYGGLYEFVEVMQYHQSGAGNIGSTQGICPEGYHVPTQKEWQTLIDFIGGYENAGGKLKEAETMHWRSPNTGATNETGFTALPGGYIDLFREGADVHFSYEINLAGTFWTATVPPDAEPPWYGPFYGSHIELHYDYSGIDMKYYPLGCYVCSVRCIKDP